MEQLEILNKDGSGTGIYKDRNDVHKDGDLHASSHVWVIRDDMDGFSVLLIRNGGCNYGKGDINRRFI